MILTGIQIGNDLINLFLWNALRQVVMTIHRKIPTDEDTTLLIKVAAVVVVVVAVAGGAYPVL